MDKQLRKARINLQISGLAVVAFSAWAVLKVILFSIVSPTFVTEAIDQGAAQDVPAGLTIAAMAAALAIFLAVHLYVGYSAWREGRGLSSGRLYIVIAAIMAAALALAVVMSVFFLLGGTLTGAEAPDDTNFISILLDASSCYACTQLVVSALQAKRLSKAPTREPKQGV